MSSMYWQSWGWPTALRSPRGLRRGECVPALSRSTDSVPAGRDDRHPNDAESAVHEGHGLRAPTHAGPWSLRSEEHRLNSSHQIISYAVFCLKKKKKYNARLNMYTDIVLIVS